MPETIDLISGALALAGAGFFIAGTVGLLRFPDIYSRLHALTKADNLGLGLIVLALLLRAPSWSHGIQLLLIWVLTLAAAAAACHLLARAALRDEGQSWGDGP